MEFSFSQLKQKEVINLNDGKNMGKVCDVSVTFPENAFIGITVTGGKGFRLTRGDMFLPVSNIVKIGEDTILVKCGGKEPPPPPCPPHKGNCPPPRGNCPPPKGNYPPPRPNPPDRRSYDEYE
ncbi:MAG: PRC-barrel domain-containing protein [Clostridia bacterium]|nr:PRC-barrel domain-containing protein [Clostridia bacterium]